MLKTQAKPIVTDGLKSRFNVEIKTKAPVASQGLGKRGGSDGQTETFCTISAILSRN
jgi:hypothetical protein